MAAIPGAGAVVRADIFVFNKVALQHVFCGEEMVCIQVKLLNKENILDMSEHM